MKFFCIPCSLTRSTWKPRFRTSRRFPSTWNVSFWNRPSSTPAVNSMNWRTKIMTGNVGLNYYVVDCLICMYIYWCIFTRGQFWPPGIVVACVCVCVSLCVNHLLVRAITRDPFKLGSTNLDHRCKRPRLWSLLFKGAIDLELQGQI